MGHDVFISYSNRDKKVADAACARLEQGGHRCWIAPRDIAGGEWGKAIVEGIGGARVFVLIFSAHANRSPQVNREVERAVSKGLPILPLRIEDVAPSDSLEYFISNQHWLDALTPPMARHLDRLAEMVGALLGGETQPGPAAPPASGPNRSRRWWAGGIAAAVGVAAIGGWLMLPWQQQAESALAETAVPATGPDPGSPPAPSPAPSPAPAPVDEHLLDFASVPVSPSHMPPTFGMTDAEPYLRNALIRLRIVELSPSDSTLFFTTGRSSGPGVPDPDRIVLRYGPRSGARLVVYPVGTPRPPPAPHFVVLELEQPVSQVSVDLVSTQTFGGVRVFALSAAGEVIDRQTYDLINHRPEHRLTLTAWGSQGIRRLRFEPESTEGFLIRAIRIRRMAQPG